LFFQAVELLLALPFTLGYRMDLVTKLLAVSLVLEVKLRPKLLSLPCPRAARPLRYHHTSSGIYSSTPQGL